MRELLEKLHLQRINRFNYHKNNVQGGCGSRGYKDHSRNSWGRGREGGMRLVQVRACEQCGGGLR